MISLGVAKQSDEREEYMKRETYFLDHEKNITNNNHSEQGIKIGNEGTRKMVLQFFYEENRNSN